MKLVISARYVLSLCAILPALTGCGEGSGTPLRPSGVTASTALRMTTAERTRVHPAYAVLYSFNARSDAKWPEAGLLNVKGTLFGTTYTGGGGHAGTVFSITSSGTESVLHSFGLNEDGASPEAGLINVKGTLYGTTFSGGVSCAKDVNGCGIVFAITTSGVETVLYRFKNGFRDGSSPFAGLLNVNGTLYGTTTYGGAHNYGTVFAIATSGAETVLHSFGSRHSGDGRNPLAGLSNVKGTLYGTTGRGGANGGGTVFAITTSGAETVLHSFGDSGDGSSPGAGLINVRGTLYGTTYEGGANNYGTVFAITTAGAETVLHSFGGYPSDGEFPKASLVNVKGTLYGTTYEGGAKVDGTVFAITPSGEETVLHNFGGKPSDGALPEAGVINVNDVLYGTTVQGGAHNSGTVFSMSP